MCNYGETEVEVAQCQRSLQLVNINLTRVVRIHHVKELRPYALLSRNMGLCGAAPYADKKGTQKHACVGALPV